MNGAYILTQPGMSPDYRRRVEVLNDPAGRRRALDRCTVTGLVLVALLVTVFVVPVALVKLVALLMFIFGLCWFLRADAPYLDILWRVPSLNRYEHGDLVALDIEWLKIIGRLDGDAAQASDKARYRSVLEIQSMPTFRATEAIRSRREDLLTRQ